MLVAGNNLGYEPKARARRFHVILDFHVQVIGR